MENFLLVILTIPLADQSLVMNLYKVHNLPALHQYLHFNISWRMSIWQSLRINNTLPYPWHKILEFVRQLRDTCVQ